jgi:hypothetical protein
VTYYVEGHLHDRINEVAKGKQNKLESNFQENETQRTICSLQKTIEQQDEMIAILWYKVYGYQPDDDEMFIYSWKSYPASAFGKAPSWTINSYQDVPEESSIVRDAPFPWHRL